MTQEDPSKEYVIHGPWISIPLSDSNTCCHYELTLSCDISSKYAKLELSYFHLIVENLKKLGPEKIGVVYEGAIFHIPTELLIQNCYPSQKTDY